MMKKLFLSTMLLAGVSFGFAKGTKVDLKDLRHSRVTLEKVCIKKPVINDGIRCVRYKYETFDANGNTLTSTTIQYCYETGTDFVDADTPTPPKLN